MKLASQINQQEMSFQNLSGKFNHLLFLFFSSLINFTALHCQVTGISVEEFYTDNGSVIGYPAGHTTYRIYANTQNESDRVSAVSGTATAPMSLSVTGSGIWNFNSGGVTGDALPCIIFNSQPLAQYDSYVTIGVDCNNDGAANPIYYSEDATNAWRVEAFNTSPYGISEFVVNTPIGGAWFALLENPNTAAGSDRKVLLAQITTNGDICGTFNLQVFPSYNGPGSQSINQRFSFGSTSGCVPGCTDPSAVNYDSQATYTDGNCLLPCSLQILNEEFFNVCDGVEEGLIEITVSGNQGYLSYSVNGIEQGLSSNNTIQIYGQTNENIIVQISDTRFDNPLANPAGLVCQIEETYFVLLNAGCNDINACNYNSSVNCNDGSCLYPGCINSAACNYNEFAGCDDGSCSFYGCMNPEACNYDPNAGCNDGSCTFPGCTDINACNYNSSAGCNNGTCNFPGCTNPDACNYDANAGCDSGSCTFPGCTDMNACNYNPSAGCNNQNCSYPGCTNPDACNYSPLAGCSDNSCILPGCTDSQACNYDVTAGCNNGSCLYISATCDDLNPNTLNDQVNTDCICSGQLLGCTNPSACNFNQLAVIDNGLCIFPGCTDITACNYNASAGCNNGTCTYGGCTDPSASNYSSNAPCEDGSCLYPGCTSLNACNYDPTANLNDSTCTFPGCTEITACNYDPAAGCSNGSCIFPDIQPGIEWQRNFGGTSGDYALSIKPTIDGGFIFVGETGSNNGDVTGNHGLNDGWVIRTDSLGNPLWNKCYGGTSDDKFVDVVAIADGSFVLIGTTESNNGDVSGNHGSSDIWAVKIDNVGNIVWQRCLGGSNIELGASIKTTSDGGYIVAGSTSSIDGNVTGNHGTSTYDIWIVKLASIGFPMWQRVFGGSENEQCSEVLQTADGGFILAGLTDSNNGDVFGNHSSYQNPDPDTRDMWIVKLGVLGQLEWQRCLGGTANEWAQSIIQTLDGGYICTAYSNSNDFNVSGNHGNNDIWVVKLNSTGTIEWQKCLGGNAADDAANIIQMSNCSYVLAGKSSSINGDVTGNHGQTDMWVANIDNEGNVLWQKCLGGSNGDGATKIIKTFDNEFAVVGYSWSNNGDLTGLQGFYDLWAVKLGFQLAISGCTNPDACNYDSETNQQNDSCYFIGDLCDDENPLTASDMYNASCECEGVVSVLERNEEINIYPNPTKGIININLSENVSFNIRLYNMMGEQTLEVSNQDLIDLSNQPSGIYLMHIEMGHKTINTLVELIN